MHPAASIGRRSGATASIRRLRQIRADNLESTKDYRQESSAKPLAVAAPPGESKTMSALFFSSGVRFSTELAVGMRMFITERQYALADFLQSCLSCSIMSSTNMLLSKAADFLVLQMGF